MNIIFQVKLKAGIKRGEASEVFVSFAPALRLYSQGETLDQAKEALADAINSYLTVAYEKGVLAKCLSNAGFSVNPHISSNLPEAKEYITVEEVEVLEEREFNNIFDVPAFLPLTQAPTQI